MNEKTPNLQTQAAMKEARAMAIKRVPELAESTVGVESFPSFTKPARQRWESIPADIRQRLLSNVWCGQCRHETTITNFSGTIKGGDLLLVGKCAECRSDVARVVETFVRGHPAVDGTALARLAERDVVHSKSSPLRRRPKNSGPDHGVPAMWRATADRLLNCWPSYSKVPSAVTSTR